MTPAAFCPIPADLVELMTPQEREAYDKALRRFVALQSPLDLALLSTRGTKEFAHIRLLNTLIVALTEHRLYKAGPCEHVGYFEDGTAYDDDDPRMEPQFHPPVSCVVPAGAPLMEKLFVTMPPRHGKSYLLSEHTPAWYLARHRERRVIFASYEAEFAASFGGRAREIIKTYGSLFDIELDKSSQAQNEWDLAGTRGGMQTAGAGGPITGKGANLLLCDDPIKNQKEALSGPQREDMWNWWHATFKTRREPGGVVVLVHTRWHEDDLGGRLLEHEGGEWFHIDLPALQPGDPDGLVDTGVHSGSRNPLCRAAGDALCPQRYTRAYLLKEQRSHPAWFEALYQQQPSTEGAGIFRKQDFRYWHTAGTPREPIYAMRQPGGGEKFVAVQACYHFQTVDLAHSTKTSADFTVISTWAATPDRELLLVGRFRKRIDSADHLNQFIDNHADLKRAGQDVKMAGVENKTFGSTLITHLRRHRPPVCQIRKLEADTDKVTRAMPAGGACGDGELYWPEEADWLQEWEKEHLAFPNGTHDDQVDTTAYAIFMLYEGLLPIRVVRTPDEVDRHNARFRPGRRGKRVHPELGRIY